MAIGAAASLLAAALLTGSFPGPLAPRAGGPLAEREDNTGELAAAWSQTRQELSLASDAGLWFPDHLDAVAGDDLASDDRFADERVDAAAPSWITAAVLGAAGLPVDADATPFDDDRTDN